MTAAVLEMRQVSKTYGTGAAQVSALDQVSLSVRPGELVAVMEAYSRHLIEVQPNNG